LEADLLALVDALSEAGLVVASDGETQPASS
jgi:hypothetical protein